MYTPAPPAGRPEAPEPIDLVRQLREALGLFAGAMPISPKQAWEEALAVVRQGADVRAESFSSGDTSPVMKDSRSADPVVADWHGYQRGGVGLHVGHVPGRKQVALYRTVGTTAVVLAYFRTEDAARSMLNVLDHLVRTDGRGVHIDGPVSG